MSLHLFPSIATGSDTQKTLFEFFVEFSAITLTFIILQFLKTALLISFF